MVRIDRLEPSKRVKGRFLVFLSTGTLLKVGEGDVIDFALSPGKELDEETLRRLTDAGRVTSAKQRAARMIGARALSKAELTQRLIAKGEGQAQAQLAADWLEDLGAVNDDGYARIVVRTYDRKGYGPRKIQDELYRRKVPRELWAEAMEEARPESEVVEEFLAARFRTRAVTRDELRRQGDALRRRGFGWDAVRSGLQSYESRLSFEECDFND